MRLSMSKLPNTHAFPGSEMSRRLLVQFYYGYRAKIFTWFRCPQNFSTSPNRNDAEGFLLKMALADQRVLLNNRLIR